MANTKTQTTKNRKQSAKKTDNIYDKPLTEETEKHAISFLARHLFSGSLALTLGAGASKSMGLPTWSELVMRCLKSSNVTIARKSLPTPSTPESQLRDLMSSVETQIRSNTKPRNKWRENYHQTVKDCLYEGVNYTQSVLHNQFNIAMGAMLSGSMRGSISDVVTFNYDDVLEWYLDLYGLKANTVTELPKLFCKSDVNIYHVHGYLPKRSDHQNSSKIVASAASYDEHNNSDKANLMKELIRDKWTSNKVLYIGLSGEDSTFGLLDVN